MVLGISFLKLVKVNKSEKRMLKWNKFEIFAYTDINLCLNIFKGLYCNPFLFSGNPDARQNTMWLNMNLNFFTRGRQEQFTLVWDDVELDETSTGEEFLASSSTLDFT